MSLEAVKQVAEAEQLSKEQRAQGGLGRQKTVD